MSHDQSGPGDLAGTRSWDLEAFGPFFALSQQNILREG